MLKPIVAGSASRFNALVVGPAGIGKTSVLRTICGQRYDSASKSWVASGNEPEPVCVFSAESGLLCVRDLVDAGQIVGYEIESLKDFIEAQNLCLSADFRASGFKWVFIDSLTEIASKCADDLQARYPNKADSFKMWGEYSRIMTDVIKSFRDLKGFNIVFTALEAPEKDSNGGATGGRQVDISGSSLKTRLPAFFDLVLHMERVRVQERVETVFSTRQPVGLAKDRSGKLSEYEMPDLLGLRNKIFS